MIKGFNYARTVSTKSLWIMRLIDDKLVLIIIVRSIISATSSLSPTTWESCEQVWEAEERERDFVFVIDRFN